MSKMGWAVVIGVVALIATGGAAGVAFAIKPGVFGELQPEMDPVMPTVAAIWGAHALGTPTITSIQDGTHAADSKHYDGLAVDIRLNDVAPDLHATLAREIQSSLGSRFYVLHEYHGTPSDHMHIQFNG